MLETVVLYPLRVSWILWTNISQIIYVFQTFVSPSVNDRVDTRIPKVIILHIGM